MSETKAFKKHLERIDLAKKTNNLMTQMSVAEKAMGILWEHLFDQLCVHDEPDWKTIKDLSNILQRILRNYQQIFKISHQFAKQNENNTTWNLSEDTLKAIEEQLQLL